MKTTWPLRIWNLEQKIPLLEKITKHKPELLKIEIEPSDEPQANIKP